MELLGIIIVLLIIQFIWNLIQSALNRFEITLNTEVKDISNKKLTIICVKGKGILPLNREDSSDATFVSTVWDITDEKKSPVLCFIRDFQINDMYFLKKTIPIPYDKTIIEDWVDLGFIIPEICVFPRSKNRHLEVHLSILNSSGEVVKTYSSMTQFYNDKKGYEEITEDKIKLFKIEIQILMQISLADGKFDKKEGNFLLKKVEDFLKNYKGEEREFLKKEMNDLLKKSYVDTASKKIDLHFLLSFFNQEATQANKYDLIKSCIDMMSIDGEIHEKELKIVDKISNHLELNYKKINELKDIHILKGSSFNFSNPKAIVGIKPSWSNAHIHSHLKEEFIKWNSRMQNYCDEKERKHIQYMLDLISEMRLKYEKKDG